MSRVDDHDAWHFLRRVSAEIGPGHSFPQGTTLMVSAHAALEQYRYTIAIPNKGRQVFTFRMKAVDEAESTLDYVVPRIAKIIKLDLLKQLN